MNTIFAIILAAAGSLGPSGAPQTEPFPLSDEYAADYAASEMCAGHPKGADAIKIGDKAVYEVAGKSVAVLLDEFARRRAIDYCWQ